MIKKITTTVTVYAECDSGEVISAKAFEELVADKVAEFKNDCWRKSEWLESKSVDAADVLDMTAAERAALESEWETAVADMAREDLLDYSWVESDVEVEVEIAIEVENTVSVQVA